MAFSRSARLAFASSYVTVTAFLVLSAVTVLTPFTSLSADSVRAAQPPQCQPETLMVSVFSGGQRGGGESGSEDQTCDELRHGHFLPSWDVPGRQKIQLERPGKRKARRAFSDVARASSAGGRPRSSASRAAVSAT